MDSIVAENKRQSRLPEWFKQEIPGACALRYSDMLSGLGVDTVCRQAKCPNTSDCFSRAEFTFMILGNICTRHCRFCAVEKSEGRSLALDTQVSARIAKVVGQLGMDYVVITSVTRDDLADAGAGEFFRVIKSIHAVKADIKVEVLIPDFRGMVPSLECVVRASPVVIAHNIETVKRLYEALRPQSIYEVSLDILKKVKELAPQILTKSSIMLGLGETEEEVITTMKDLRQSQCDILTLGQYLSATVDNYPVKEFITPTQFSKFRDLALELGFLAVQSAPKARSSYRAADLYKICTLRGLELRKCSLTVKE